MAHACFPFLPRFMAKRVLGRDPTPGRWVLCVPGADSRNCSTALRMSFAKLHSRDAAIAFNRAISCAGEHRKDQDEQ